MLNPDAVYKTWPPLIRYSLALALFSLALLLRLILMPVQGGLAFVTFYPVILISFYLFGTGSGTLVSILSGFAGTYFFMPPYGGGFPTDSNTYISLAFFALTSLLIGVIITRLHSYSEALKRQVQIDFLTELSSRGHFMDQAELELNRAVRYDNPLSLLMVDVDFFKQINDSHGHKAGDTVLKKLAEVCRQALREVDIIGRVGGEEFAILLPQTDKEKAAEVAERLRIALPNAKVPLQVGGLPLHFTVSIGLTSLSSKEDNIDVLLNLADKALYEAKNSGRNRICIAMQ